jgi:hypothetical protein
LKVPVDEELKPAVEALTEMSEKKYPLGKLTLLKQAHKAIVGMLRTACHAGIGLSFVS